MTPPTDTHALVEAWGGPVLAVMFLYGVAESLLVHGWRRRHPPRDSRALLWALAAQSAFSAGATALLGPVTIFAAALAGAALSPIEAGLSWPWWVGGWVVYEFFYWVQHWAAHKVRMLWCFHSPHHAPRGISMLIGANHSPLETTLYFPIFMGFLPALCGVHPVIAFAINLLDVFWGSLLHISDSVVKTGRYGILERFLQTPAHHRAHHAKNVRYLDTNYNSITLLWDWVFGTLQRLDDDDPVEFGITRDVDTGSFFDLHLGEFRLLFRDLREASSWRDRLGYLFRPPGWRPGDPSGTVAARKAASANAH